MKNFVFKKTLVDKFTVESASDFIKYILNYPYKNLYENALVKFIKQLKTEWQGVKNDIQNLSLLEIIENYDLYDYAPNGFIISSVLDELPVPYLGDFTFDESEDVFNIQIFQIDLIDDKGREYSISDILACNPETNY